MDGQIFDKKLSDLEKQFGSAEHEPHISYRRLSDIQASPIDWLWKNHIAKGKLTLIAGNPGLGKSQLTMSIVSIVTRGGRWPVDNLPCNIGGVIILSAEDTAEDVIRPRLEAAGADLTKTFIIDAVQENNESQSRRGFNLETDIEHLGSMLNKLQNEAIPIALIIIDPITAYLGNTDAHKNAEVRSLLVPLSTLAEQYHVAVIAVSHLSKDSKADALMRISGSLAFVAAARAAFLVAQDNDDESKLLFLPLKNNIGNSKTGLSFKIESCTVNHAIETSRIIWLNDLISKTAQEVMRVQGRNTFDALQEAETFLHSFLADGPKPTKEIEESAKAHGHTWATVRRAKTKLGVRVNKAGMDGGWQWSLPPKILTDDEDAQDSRVPSMSIFEENEHLQQDLNSSTNLPLVITNSLQCESCGYRAPFCICKPNISQQENHTTY